MKPRMFGLVPDYARVIIDPLQAAARMLHMEL